MKKSTLIIITLILTLVAGCTIPFSEDGDTPSASQTPPAGSEQPTETAFIDDMLYAHIDENNAAIKNLVDYGSISASLPQYNEQDYASVSDYIHAVAGQLSPTPFAGLDTDAAAAGLKAMMEEEFGITANCSYKVGNIDPTLLAVLLYNLNGAADESSSIGVAGALNYAIDPPAEGESVYSIDVDIDFPAPLAIIETICQSDFNQYMNIRLMYAYILTIYDEEGERAEAPGNTSPLPEQWTFPLASHTRLTDTWLADRSNGTRKHTGTDILADEGTEIYSCSDARVLSVGYTDSTGNYVWTRDNYGYEYIYMHMVELTESLQAGDSVEAGGLIGKVGNTGNSATNHLHLSVITTDNDYLNPFAELADALERKNNPPASPEATTTGTPAAS